MILSAKNMIEVVDLPQIIGRDKGRPAVKNEASLQGMIEQFEKDILEELLSRKLNAIQISKMLQIDVTTVRRKLHKYCLLS